MSTISLVAKKLEAFRMTVPSLILLAFASYRTLTSGYSIQLVAVCADVVFISALILVLTLSFMNICYGRRPRQKV